MFDRSTWSAGVACLSTLAALVTTGASAAAAATIVVPAEGSLQDAIDAARPGDIILLEAGVTYTGNFRLPAHGGDAFITIRSAAADALVPGPGVRVTPADAAWLPKIKSPNTMTALTVLPGASHWRLQLLEFQANVGGLSDIIKVGSATEAVPSRQPHHIVFDRLYIHGDPVVGQKNGIVAHASHFELRDSYISDIKQVGAETHAFISFNGPGPYLLENNYLEASGINVMFGGADPINASMVPSDITIRRNHVAKNLAWMTRRPDGKYWTVKNLFELKSGRRVLVEGNLFEHNWSGAGDQPGYAILMRTENQYGACDWCETGHVVFQNNIVRKTPGGISLTGLDYPKGGTPRGVRLHDVTIRNNLFTDIDVATWKLSAANSSAKFAIVIATERVTFDHNTMIMGSQTAAVYLSGAQDSTAFVYTNNLTEHENYGIKGDSTASGTASLTAFTVNAIATGNVLAGGKASAYPAGNYFPPVTNWNPQFVDFAAGNYRLSQSSLYRNGGTDGKDIGADFAELLASFERSHVPEDQDGGVDDVSPQSPIPNAVPSVTLSGPGDAVFVGAAATLTAVPQDADGTIARVDFRADGQLIGTVLAAPFTLEWVVPTAAMHAVTAVAFDDRGASATSTAVTVRTRAEVVLYASQATRLVGRYTLLTDPTAAGGVRLHNPNRDVAKAYAAAAAPASYAEFTFYAEGGRPYQVWFRGKAERNSWANDSMFVQFSGDPTKRIGSTNAMSVTLEEAVNAGLSNWGWQDDGFGVGLLGVPVVFESTGQQVIRLQPREDGLSIDQIVISPQQFLTVAPGAIRNDATVIAQ
jgi:hypothetical protein